MSTTAQFTTFYLGQDLYGIEVMKVQEITQKPVVVPVPLAPQFLRGLINLRGQIATALGLRELFQIDTKGEAGQMTVVCKMDGNLVSLLVDAIGDVLEVNADQYESAPDTLQPSVRKYLKGVYKMDGKLLSILDLDILSKELSQNLEAA